MSSWLIAATKRQGFTEEKEKHWLYGDAISMVVAGSDTVAPALVFIFYHLARYPATTERLRQELRSLDCLNNISQLVSLPYLSAFINETLRLFPTTPTGGYREAPPEGLHVGGQFIPGGTTIVAPAYNIGRREPKSPRITIHQSTWAEILLADSAYFDSPDDFVPERWLDQSHMVYNKRAFAPFKQGRHGCVGKKLALAELSLVVASLVSKYSIKFAPGDDGSAVISDMRDCFTAKPGQLNLLFESL
ncbi:MAG: hypothetical protein Q9222_002027 [Ikaeria aurantiellina]